MTYPYAAPLLVLLLAACGPSKDDTATTDATTTTAPDPTSGTSDDTATTDGNEVMCPCVPDDAPSEQWGQTPSLPSCGEQLCPVVHIACEYSCENAEDMDIEIDDPDALTCILTALEAGTPGYILYEIESASGLHGESGYHLTRADGTAIHRIWGTKDLAFVVGDALQGVSPDYACAGAQSEASRIECMIRRPTGTLTNCDTGWYVSDL